MNKFRTLKDYSEDMQKGSDSPEILANLLIEMGSHYAYLTEQHIFMNLEKASFQDKAKYNYSVEGKEIKREKAISDDSVEIKWRITEKGKKEYATKRNLKAIENLKRDLNTILFQKTQEAKQ